MKTLAIARNTFREAIRDRVFAIVGVFGLVLVSSSLILSPLTVGAQNKIVIDVGLASINLFALLIVLFVGSGMVTKEIERRTIMTILSKPISRLEYMVGKYLGLMATLVSVMAAMVALFLLVIWVTPAEFRLTYASALGLSLLEMLVVTAVAMFFSSFTTPVLTALFTLGVFVVGHTVSDLLGFAEVMGSEQLVQMMTVVKMVLPNLELFDVRGAAARGETIANDHMLWALGYAVAYSALMLGLAGWLFHRREFK